MRIHIKKHTNLFVFVGTLAGVRLSTLLNKTAQKNLFRVSGGVLTQIEQQALNSFARVFSSTVYDPVEACFIRFDKRRVQKEIARRIGKENARTIADVLKVFSNRFARFWKKEETRIKQVKKCLTRAKQTIYRSSKFIDVLCGYKKGITAHTFSSINLLFGGNNEQSLTGWYSSFSGGCDLILEYSPDRTVTSFIIGVLLHEAFHVALHRNISLYRLLKRVAQKHIATLSQVEKGMPAHTVLEECFLGVFAPEGVLINSYRTQHVQTQKYLSGLLVFRRYCAREMQNEARRHITEQKKIDEPFLLLLIQKIKKGVAKR